VNVLVSYDKLNKSLKTDSLRRVLRCIPQPFDFAKSRVLIGVTVD
jgi:hypothetical protein